MNVRTVVGETYSANAQGNGMLIVNADSAKQGKNRFKWNKIFVTCLNIWQQFLCPLLPAETDPAN